MALLPSWPTEVLIALTELGGRAHLSMIYPIVLRERKRRGATIGTYEECIRNALHENSRGRGHDWFEHHGSERSGYWGIKRPDAPKG